MSDTPNPTTAGALLRQARQAQGLHIAALAAAIKVVPRKLELLESDQFDQLPDATFTRALANTVCRTLKIDPGPVLALLPPLPGHRLEHVAEGLKTPFEEGPGRLSAGESASVATPVLVLAAVLIVAAIAVFFAPSSWLQWRKGGGAAAEASAASAGIAVTTAAASAADAGVMPPADAASGADAVVPPTPSTDDATGPDTTVPTAQAAAAASAGAATKAAGVLQVKLTDASWVEVIDARGKSLISRLVPAGESVVLDGAMPFKVKIGNASATQVVFRGQPLDLAPYTRDNMAKLQLK